MAQGERRRVEPIRHTITVRSDPERTFDLFTRRMGTWWPLEEYSRVVNEGQGQSLEVVRLEFQPRRGGSILEHTSDGRVLPWAEVITWEPPRRVTMAWRPHAQPEPPTEVDVIFRARAGGTVVEVEHRGWDRLSVDFREALYDVYVRGWVTTLGLFGAAANASAGDPPFPEGPRSKG
jgi:uncharacterized protein YndB with AHSA1/START domain